MLRPNSICIGKASKSISGVYNCCSLIEPFSSIKNPEKPNPPPEKRITLPIDNPQPPPEEGIIDPIKKPERPGVPGNPPIDYVKNCKYGLEEIMTYSSEIRKDIQTIKENNEKFIKSVEKNLDYIEHAKDRVFNPDIPY